MKSPILVLLLSIAIFACSNDDEPSPSTILGSWHMVAISGGLAGTYEEINRERVVWTFEETTVNIRNIEGASGFPFGPETGEYFYQVEERNGFQVLTVDEWEYGVMTFEGNRLTVDQRAVDGFLLTFER